MTRRAFTLMELVIVVGIILLLAALALSVSTALLARTERQKMADTLSILDAAVREWEASNGRQLTIGLESGTATYDIKEVSGGAYMIVPILDLLQKSPASRELLARIPPELIRRLPPGNAVGQWPGPGFTYPVPITEARDIVDPWGQRIAVANPGRPRDRYDLPGTAYDEDGTIRTSDELIPRGFGGVCTARRMRFISSGPDGQFFTPGNPVGMTEANDPKVADNIFSYGGPR